jgi:S1-C subfamily serine protease
VGVLVSVTLAGGTAAWWLPGSPGPAEKRKAQVPAPAQPPPRPPAEMAVRDQPPQRLLAEAPIPAGELPGPERLGGERIYPRLLRSAAFIVTPADTGGSGTLIHPQRKLVLTSYHVVAGRGEVRVCFPCYDGDHKLIKDPDYYLRQARDQFLIGKVVKHAEDKDLALLSLDAIPGSCQAMRLAPRQVLPGQTVHSIGNPGAVGALWAYTSGSVRQVSHKTYASEAGGRVQRFDAEVVETQNPTNPGDSGGPLVDDFGQLVGVTQGGHRRARAVSYFIDVTEVQKFLQSYGIPPEEVVGPQPAQAAGPAVAKLLRDLGSPDAEVWARAARQLGEHEGDARPALEALVKALGDPDEAVRRAAAGAVRRLGWPPADLLSIVTVSGSTIAYNQAQGGGAGNGEGGGIADLLSATTAVAGSSLDHNEAISGGGGAGLGFNPAPFPSPKEEHPCSRKQT